MITSASRRLAPVGLVLAATGLAAGRLASSWGFSTDDAYISLRYARHLAEGSGLLWNVGEPPVEGFSNPLSVLMGAVALWAGLDPLFVLKLSGAVAALASLWLAFALVRRLGLPPLAASAAPVLLVAHKGTWLWAVSGLETGHSLAATLLVFVLLAGAIRPQSGLMGFLAAGVAAGLAGLIRPDGVVTGVAAGIALVGWSLLGAAERRRRLHALLVFCLGALALWMPYFVFRLWYFGRPFPNTVYCKALYEGNPLALHSDLGGLTWILLLSALLLLVARKGQLQPAMMAVTLQPVLAGLALYGADPIIGDHQRLFVPSIGALAVLAAVGWYLLSLRLKEAAEAAFVPATFAVVVLGVLMIVEPAVGPFVAAYQKRMEGRREVAHLLEERLPPEQAYVIGDAGLVPYLTSHPVRDAYCLNERAFTSPPVDGSPRAWADHVLKTRPGAIIVHSFSAERILPHAFHGTFPALVGHPSFRDDYLRVDSVRADAEFSYVFFLRRDLAGGSGPSRGTEPDEWY